MPMSEFNAALAVEQTPLWVSLRKLCELEPSSLVLAGHEWFWTNS